MKDVRIIKTYSRVVGKLVFVGTHRANDLVPLVDFFRDGSDEAESPGVLYGRDHDNYHLETPENLERLRMMQEIDESVEQLKARADVIALAMTDPIYAESYWKHATVDTSEKQVQEDS